MYIKCILTCALRAQISQPDYLNVCIGILRFWSTYAYCPSQIIKTELFKCLQEKHGMLFENFILSKLVPVVGDMRKTNIGIEEEVANRIATEVDVIINSAATTTFDER